MSENLREEKKFQLEAKKWLFVHSDFAEKWAENITAQLTLSGDFFSAEVLTDALNDSIDMMTEENSGIPASELSALKALKASRKAAIVLMPSEMVCASSPSAKADDVTSGNQSEVTGFDEKADKCSFKKGSDEFVCNIGDFTGRAKYGLVLPSYEAQSVSEVLKIPELPSLRSLLKNIRDDRNEVKGFETSFMLKKTGGLLQNKGR